MKYPDGLHVVIIPNHDEIASGTFKSILSMSGISLEDFLQNLNDALEKKVESQMCTQNELIKILEVFAGNVKKEIDSKLSDIILFGSYARGDYDEESDVDVAVIVDIPQGEEHTCYKQLTKIIGDIDELFNYNNRMGRWTGYSTSRIV